MNSDIYRMFVLTQFNSASLNAHIKNYNFSVLATFVDILAAEQTPDNLGFRRLLMPLDNVCLIFF
jgi:glucose-1-phosphate adenylyltransferase